MAKARNPDSNVKITTFAKDELDELVETLSTFAPALKVTDYAVMGALILAARRLPIETVAAVVSTYWERDAEAAAINTAAINAVCEFVGHYGR